MIDRSIVLRCAEQAGFGGQTRATMLPRLIRFATFIAEHQRSRDATLCNAIGDTYKDMATEFGDGQMDGCYRCAELIATDDDKQTT